MHLWLFFVYFAINKPITIEMKHFVGISLFLLALPMVAAEAPMSYVRFTTPDPLALSYPSLSPPTAQTTRHATWIWMEQQWIQTEML